MTTAPDFIDIKTPEDVLHIVRSFESPCSLPGYAEKCPVWMLRQLQCAGASHADIAEHADVAVAYVERLANGGYATAGDVPYGLMCYLHSTFRTALRGAPPLDKTLEYAGRLLVMLEGDYSVDALDMAGAWQTAVSQAIRITSSSDSAKASKNENLPSSNSAQRTASDPS